MEEQRHSTPQQDAAAPLPPPVAPSATGAPWKLQRSPDRLLGGVAAGIAASTGVDVTLVRLAFVAAGLSGFGVVAYLILWIVVPEADPRAGRPLLVAPPDTARWLRVALVVGAVIGLAGLLGGPFGWDGPNDGDAGFALGMMLIVVGAVALWSRRRSDGSAHLVASTGAPVMTPPSRPSTAAGWPAPSTPDAGAGSGMPPTATPPTGLPPAGGPTPQRASAGLILARVFGWMAVVGTLFVGSGFVVAVSIGALPMHLPGLVAAIGLAAFVTLVVVTAAARTASPIVAALALVAGSFVLGIAMIDWGEGVGERINVPETLAEVRPHYELAAGRRVLDLSQVALPETAPLAIEIDHRIGQVDVVLPVDATLTANVEVGIGEIQVLGRRESGFSADLIVEDVPESARGQVDLEVDMGIGQVRVCRASVFNGGEQGCTHTR